MSTNIAQLRELLSLARQLGFQDDVEHWEAEIAAAERAQSAVSR